jgi:O-antigen/teichoic acid export membrane protein
VASSLINRTHEVVQVYVASAQSGRLRDVLIRRSVGSFALSVTGTALSFGIAVFLARMLGASGYGSYTYAKTWVGVLGVFAPLGFEVLALRNMAAYQTRHQWDLMRGLLHKASQLAVLASLGLVVVGGALSLVSPLDDEMRAPIFIALVSLPIVALLRIRSGAMHGLQHVLMAQVPGAILQPALLVALVLAAYVALDGGLSASWAMAMSVAASAITLLVIGRLLRNVVPQAARESTPAYQTTPWLKSALPLLFVNGIFIVMSATDTLMLGAMKGAESVGPYAVAKQGALLITFVWGAVNTALAPTIASLHAAGERETLQRIITKSIRLALLAAAPIGLALVVYGDWFLMIFGSEFAQGRAAMTILSLGLLARLALGSVSLLLLMTGHERDAAIGAAAGALVNAGLNVALLPAWGMEGAAVATSASMILLSLGLITRVHKRIGVRPTVLGVV